VIIRHLSSRVRLSCKEVFLISARIAYFGYFSKGSETKKT
jgi:hypothetical protein